MTTRQDRDLAITLWQDSKPVTILHTNTDPITTCGVNRKLKNGSNATVRCPTAISMYNKYMGGVDLGDQLRGYYQVRMKSRKMYKYIFWFILEISILTFYTTLYRLLLRHTPTINKAFRTESAKLLIGNYCWRKKAGHPSLMPAPSAKRPNMAHFPRKCSTGR